MSSNDVQAGKPWYLAHGVLMTLAWIVLIPLGALMAIYGNETTGTDGTVQRSRPSFYISHRNLTLAGALLTSIGFSMAFVGNLKAFGTGNPSFFWDFGDRTIAGNRHVAVGFCVFLLSFIEILLGIWYRFREVWYNADASRSDSSDGPVWKNPVLQYWLHVLFGYGLMVSAFTAVVMGFQMFGFLFGDEVVVGVRVGYGVSAFFCSLFLGAAAKEKILLSR